jgi:hypothetical protein
MREGEMHEPRDHRGREKKRQSKSRRREHTVSVDSLDTEVEEFERIVIGVEDKGML